MNTDKGHEAVAGDTGGQQACQRGAVAPAINSASCTYCEAGKIEDNTGQTCKCATEGTAMTL